MMQFSKKQFLVLGIALLSSAFIWWVGPFIAIANKFILADVLIRSSLIATILLAAFFFAFDFDTKKINLNKTFSILDKFLLKAEIDSLQASFSNADTFLKNAFPTQEKESALPYYLVLGPTQSGKTTFLSHADLNFVATEQFVQRFSDDTFSSTQCNWWFSSSGMFLDIPGHFINSESEKTIHSWDHLVKLIKTYNQRQPLSGLILVINVYELAKQKNPNPPLFETLQKKLFLLRERIKKPLPLYLVFSQCDRISGFNEFFSDLGTNERQHYWGFSLFNNEENKTVTDVFKQEFDHFIRRLNQRLIWRLHHERDLETKFLIRDFPSQLENLKETLSNLVHALTHPASPLNCIAGVYFCSSTQKGEQIDNLVKTLAPIRTIEHTSLMLTTSFARSYFIQHFFSDIILNSNTPETTTTHIKTKASPIGYTLILIPPILASIFWIQNYQKQNVQFTLANQAYRNYENTIKKENLTPTQLLIALNQLQTAQLHLDRFQPSVSLRNKLALKNTWEQSTQTAYQNALKTLLLPQVFSVLEQKLLSVPKTHPEQAYSLLKDYLMLATPSHLDVNYLHQTLLSIHTAFGLSQSEMEQYYYHLIQLLTGDSIPTLIPNETAVQHARHLLDDMPYPLLAYALIKTSSPYKTLSFFENKSTLHAFHFTDPQFSFSSLYTAAPFSDIYTQLIPIISEEVSIGNWILGKKKQGTLSKEELNELVGDVREFYLTDYLANWQKLINSIQLNGFSNFSESYLVLNALSENTNSALENVFQVIAANTSAAALTKKIDPTQDGKLFIDTLSKENFDKFNQITLNPDLLHSTIATLNTLSQDIHRILLADKPNEVALQISQRYFQNPDNNPIDQLLKASNLFPAPVKDWLETIAFGNWKLLLDASNQAISTEWKKNVLPYYRSTLNQRYPLVKNALFEAKLEDFQQFFSPQGKLATFFDHYLKSFIDTQHPRWQLLKLAGMSISLSNNALEQFERASIISRMFFPDNSDQMNARFFLQPLALMPGLKEIAIRYDGKEAIDTPDNAKLSAWSWPNINSQTDVSIEFITVEGQTTTLSKKGPWAWFHLFDQSHLQATTEPKRFELTFDMNGNSAKYFLIANTTISPFIPGLIDQFRFPDNL